MRVIRPARASRERPWALAVSLAVSLALVVTGGISIVLMKSLPGNRVSGVAALGIAAALAIGIGLAWLIRALANRQRRTMDDDLLRVLAPTLDDSYVLVLSPRLPGVPPDLAALVIGPAGVRALVARHWPGRYRVRGRGWEYDTRTRAGWIPCRTNPSFDAHAVAGAVGAWTRAALDDVNVPVVPAVAFPRPESVVVLEEPDIEVITHDNAPWWAQRIGRVQRLDHGRVGRMVQAVIDAGDALSLPAPAGAQDGVR
ncbi:MAG TPA: hypothetical protein VIA82_08625 [Candidatus Limnocylindria bacterium]|jgi:hypothetical protein